MKAMKKLTLISLAVVISLMVKGAWAVSLKFDPSASNIGVNDIVSVNILIDGLEGIDLSTFDFNVNYDPAVLLFDSYILGTDLGAVDGTDALDWSFGDVEPGIVHLSELSYLKDLSSQPAGFILATLSFTGKASGHSALSISDIVLGDFDGELIEEYSVDSGSIHVGTPVPEPATMLLIGTGLAGLLAAGARKKKQ